MFTQRATLTIVAGFAAGLIIAACNFSEDEPTHCSRSTGKTVCSDRYGSDRPYCTIPSCDVSGEGYYGCVEEEPTADCNYACGGNKTILDDNSCEDVGDGDPGDGDGDTGDGDGDTGDGDGDGDMPCEGHGDCTDPEAPFCDTDSGECVGCDGIEESDLACEEADASTPVCLEGSCVQCTEDKEGACGGVTPICDFETSMCVACSDHGQCQGSACNMAVGNCIDAGNIRYVNGGTVTCNDGGDGSQGTPYCTLVQALLNSPAEALLFITGLDGEAPYAAAHGFGSTKAIFGIPSMQDELPVIQGASMAAGITVSPGGNLYMRNITIYGTPNARPGLRINGGNAWIEQSRIVNNTGGGIVVEGGGMLMLENSFVGQDTTGVSAVSVTDGTFEIVYSTLAAGNDFGDMAHALKCESGNRSMVRNSFLVSQSNSPEITAQCAPALVNNAMEGVFPGNTSVGNLQPTWFVGFASGDYRLNMPPAGLEEAATWQTGDPATDIEGAPRPTTDGSKDYAGADRL